MVSAIAWLSPSSTERRTDGERFVSVCGNGQRYPFPWLFLVSCETFQSVDCVVLSLWSLQSHMWVGPEFCLYDSQATAETNRQWARYVSVRRLGSGQRDFCPWLFLVRCETFQSVDCVVPSPWSLQSLHCLSVGWTRILPVLQRSDCRDHRKGEQAEFWSTPQTDSERQWTMRCCTNWFLFSGVSSLA